MPLLPDVALPARTGIQQHKGDLLYGLLGGFLPHFLEPGDEWELGGSGRPAGSGSPAVSGSSPSNELTTSGTS